MFKLDEYITPIRTFCFPEDPEIKDVTFSESDVLEWLDSIRLINDHTPPSLIDDSLIRRLFVLYLSRKERLVDINGKLYENVFNHNGRDILNEVIASILAKFLNIKIPNNYFGISSTVYRHPSKKKPAQTQAGTIPLCAVRAFVERHGLPKPRCYAEQHLPP